MPIFLIDGGYFVGRFEKHNYSKGNRKNMNWWNQSFKSGKCNKIEMLDNCKRIFNYDITYLEMKMKEIGEIEKVIVCYDGIFGRRGRGKIFKDYKRNRGGIKATKHKGIDVRDKIKRLGIDPDHIKEGWDSEYIIYKEADDLLAELALREAENGNEVVVMSKDSDLLQVLEWGDSIRLHNMTTELTEQYILDRYGIDSSNYVDWKSLSGDKSDNISGVPGIGPSTAKKLIIKHKTLENIPHKYFIKEDIDYREQIYDYKKIIKLPFIYPQ